MRAFQLLFLVFLLVPLGEIYLLIKVGSVIGAPWTIFAVVFTAVLGAWLLRLQGLSTFMRVRASLDRGELPALPMLEGLLLLIAGALLLTPGFFTDAVGFVLLVPALRARLALALLRSSVMHVQTTGHPRRPADGGRTLEGEFRREDD
ncbi:MAG: FxsA family protein [Pseudomonadota bacterium]|nr:MAG: FxsA family protein [Pseudomonadota bacterium]